MKRQTPELMQKGTNSAQIPKKLAGLLSGVLKYVEETERGTTKQDLGALPQDFNSNFGTLPEKQ